MDEHRKFVCVSNSMDVAILKKTSISEGQGGGWRACACVFDFYLAT